ncbi:thioredoxin fold domain-containing protein [bacterium]|nr:thioredoxin fold domain-containing protein [bacterium]
MELTAKSFKDKVLASPRPVLVEFWASWCLPCKQVEPTLKKLADAYRGRCDVYKINVDRNPTASRDYSIQGLPTFATFRDGKELERKTASQSEEELEGMIRRALAERGDGVSGEEQRIIEERLKDLGYL